MRQGESLEFPANEQPRIVSIVAGQLADRDAQMNLEQAENILLPWAWAGALTAESAARVLITDRFV